MQNDDENNQRRKAARDLIKYAILFCGGNLKNFNMEAFLDKLGF